MQFRSRDLQTRGLVSAKYNLLSFHETQNDEIFDGIVLPRTSTAVRWIKENTVHQALKITANAATSAPFLSTQVSAIRDERRGMTHILTQEADGLYVTKVQNVAILERHRVSDHLTTRHTFELRKYDGAIVIAYVSAGELFLDGTRVPTSCQRVDFPVLTIDQPPIGHIALEMPTIGVLTYKCRESNNLYVRTFNPSTLSVGPEIQLQATAPLGGADVVCHDGRCFIRVDALEDGKVRSFFGASGVTDLAGVRLTPLALDGVPYDEIQLSTCRSFIDHTGNYHTPILLRHGQMHTVVDVMPHDDLAVAAISVPGVIDGISVNVFPKNPGKSAGFRPGFGDGITDGNGIIVSASAVGGLHSANSQSGGYSYPESGLLNHEMPRIFAFRATECYTRGAVANVVSMDYLFVEADDQGNPVDSTIWLETWDMPLPLPEVTAAVNEKVVTLTIQKDGWFVPGKTTVTFSDLSVSVLDIRKMSERSLELSVDRSPQSGSTVEFETKNEFFHHKGIAIIPR